MTQLDDMDFIAVSIQRERRDQNSQLQCLAGLCNSPNQQLFGLQKAVGSIKRAYFAHPHCSVWTKHVIVIGIPEIWFIHLSMKKPLFFRGLL
jgi:hypothetical protein